MQTDPNWANFLWDDKKQKVGGTAECSLDTDDMSAATHRLWRHEGILCRIHGQVVSPVEVGHR